MNRPIENKLNYLMRHWPTGVPLTSYWLKIYLKKKTNMGSWGMFTIPIEMFGRC